MISLGRYGQKDDIMNTPETHQLAILLCAAVVRAYYERNDKALRAHARKLIHMANNSADPTVKLIAGEAKDVAKLRGVTL